MKKFGRFEFKAKEPAETYEGDYMEQDGNCVCILTGVPGALGSPRLVAVILLENCQSVREIKEQKSSAVLKQATGRKFR
jgi:hypothetical protein